ncbi:MAG: hypothetical protein NVS3B5_14920 [Sphingomicrobium sp.]
MGHHIGDQFGLAVYAASFAISVDDLEAITAAVKKLREIVESVSREWIDDLLKKAGLTRGPISSFFQLPQLCFE